MNNQVLTKPWYQHSMVWLVIGLPMLSVVVGIGFLITAVSGSDDVVMDNYYKEGKMINQSFDEDEQARLQGVQAKVSFASGKMRMELMGVKQPFVRFWLFHSTEADFDLSGALAKVAENSDAGVYEYQFTSAPQGQWYFEIKGDDGLDKNVWRLRSRVVLPTEQPLLLLPAVD